MTLNDVVHDMTILDLLEVFSKFALSVKRLQVGATTDELLIDVDLQSSIDKQTFQSLVSATREVEHTWGTVTREVLARVAR